MCMLLKKHLRDWKMRQINMHIIWKSIDNKG